jgi:hypothetical protein
MIPRDALNDAMNNLKVSSSDNELRVVTKDGQEARISIEGSTISATVGSEAGGFQSMTATVTEDAISDEVVVSVMTDDVPGIDVKKSGSNTSNITTLTGSSNVDQGFLNATITTGNSKGVKEVLNVVVQAPKDKINAVVQTTSPLPNKVVSAVNTPDLGETITVVQKKSVKQQFEKMNNPFGSIIDGLSAAQQQVVGNSDLGSIGQEFSNILSNLAGAIAGVGNYDGLGKNLPSLPGGLPDEFGVPTIEVIDPLTGKPAEPIVKIDGSTNLSNVVQKSGRISANVKPSAPVYQVSNINPDYKGENTDLNTYTFELINSAEELEAELRNVKRDTSTVIVDWTSTFNNINLRAKDIHKISLKDDGSDKVSFNGTDRGIQAHYIFTRDGLIQRGRPINLKPWVHLTEGYSENSIWIQFVAGLAIPYSDQLSNISQYFSSASITSEQWKSFDKFLEAMYKANPGMQILGRGYIDGDIAPGFDPREYVEVKYKKISVYSSTIEKHKEVIGNRLLTKQEISTSLPPKIVVSKVDQAKAVPSIEKLSTATQDMDTETGNITLTQAEADALSAEWLAEREVFYTLLANRNNTRGDRNAAGFAVKDTEVGTIERADAIAKVEKLNADLEKIKIDMKASRKRTDAIVNRAESAGYIAGGDWKNGEPVFVTEEEYKKRYK